MEIDLNSPDEYNNGRLNGSDELALSKSSICMELWHACAGPLISLPRKGTLVVYFPQGHLEQASTSLKQQQMRPYDLPPQIFCRVLNVNLHADQETDEVYAQVTLVPEPEPLEDAVGDKEEDDAGVLNKPTPHMFCKTLTASDTSTHGGFSVPRRAAEDCFPPLDYTQQRPSQELLAKDLHGIEWKFRHIYRGQPRRHLLTTGWSVFVSHKGLVSGDAVLFLRGENGELRLGIRRATRQKSGIPSSILSNQNAHLSVLAAAANAVATKSMFHIFYNPRTSPAEFIIPYQKYVKSCKQPLSIGMRFKMRFETEDTAERRYTGMITAIGDADPARWPGSKWRLLKVEWDEHAANEQQERVSAWEIEPSIAGAGLNVSSGTRTKRLRSTLLSTPVDVAIPDGSRLLDFEESVRFQKVLQGQENMSFKAPSRNDGVGFMKCPILDRKGCNAVPEGFGTARTENEIWSSLERSDISSRLLDFGESVRFQKVLQGQEILPSKASLTSAEVDLLKFQLWDCKRYDAEGSEGATPGNKNWPSLGRPNLAPFSAVFSNKGKFGNAYGTDKLRSEEYSCAQFSNTNMPHLKVFTKPHSGGNRPTCPVNSQNLTTIPGTSPLSSIFSSRARNDSELHVSGTYPVCRTNVFQKNDLYGDYSQPFNRDISAQFDVPKMAVGWQASSVLPRDSDNIQPATCTAGLSSSDPSKKQEKLIEVFLKQHQLPIGFHSTETDRGGVQGKQSCKLFGFSLVEESACMADVISGSIPHGDITQEGSPTIYRHGIVQSSISQNQDNLLKVSVDHSPEALNGSAQQNTLQAVSGLSTLVQTSGRRRTKVHKQGSVVGRAVDLSKLDGYDQLICELERLFDMEGLLNDPKKGWQVLYTDNEDDMMLVGDDPWQEFCNIACKILIYTHDEVQKMTPSMFSDDVNSSEEQPSTVEVSKSSIDNQDSSSPLMTGNQ
jgi:hypothetical protein